MFQKPIIILVIVVCCFISSTEPLCHQKRKPECVRTCKRGYCTLEGYVCSDISPLFEADPNEECCGQTCCIYTACALPPDRGPCTLMVPKYYYNTTTETCLTFIYGGCEGNLNNFFTIALCEYACGEKDVI